MNVTLSIDDRILARARQLAHRRGISLDQLVGEHLEMLTANEKLAAKLESLWREEEESSGGKAEDWDDQFFEEEDRISTPGVPPRPKTNEVFRETFLHLLSQEHLSAFHGFAEAMFSLTLESARYSDREDWGLHPSEVYPAEEFLALVADLRYFQRYLNQIADIKGSVPTPRLVLSSLFATRISGQLGEIADAIKRGVQAGFVEEG